MFLYFQLIIAGYILSVYNQLQEEQQRMTPGNTPVKRRHDSQSQVAVFVFEQYLDGYAWISLIFSLSFQVMKLFTFSKNYWFFGRIAKQFLFVDWWCPSVNIWLTSAFKFFLGHINQYRLDTLHGNRP